MNIEKNVQVVKDFFAAIDSGDQQRLLSLVAEEWIIPGAIGHWPVRTAGRRDWRI